MPPLLSAACHLGRGAGDNKVKRLDFFKGLLAALVCRKLPKFESHPRMIVGFPEPTFISDTFILSWTYTKEMCDVDFGGYTLEEKYALGLLDDTFTRK